MSNRYVLQVHHIVGDSINVDRIDLPKRGTWASHHKKDGRTLITIWNRKSKITWALQYRQAERISVSRRDDRG